MLKRSLVALLLTWPLSTTAVPLMDLVDIEGIRGNQLIGYGLVVGLDGSGDRTSQAPFTVQSLKNLLGELGVNVPPNVNPQLKNVAAVAIRQLTVGEAVWAGGRSKRHGRGQGVPWIYAPDGAGLASRLTERGIISTV